MTMPALPAQGSTSWYPWATGVDSAARNTARTDTDNVFNGDQQVNGYLGVNATGDAKQPVVFTETLNGPALIASGSLLNKISHQINAIITGDFTGDGGADAGFLWGQNVFTLTGPNTNDGKGIDTLTSSLVEVNVNTPAGTTFGTVCGQEVSAAFWGATAGAHVNTMMSQFVRAPRRSQGATGGTVGNAYTLFVEGLDAADVTATSALSLYVEGGISRFGGRVDVNGTIANSGSGDLALFAGFSNADGAALTLGKSGTGGHAQIKLGASGSVFAVASSGGSNVLQMDNGGNVNLAGGLGLFGTSAVTSKPAVTGSRGGNAALTSLLTALATYGLVTNSTTA